MDNVEIAYNAEKSWPTAVVTSGECYGGCGSGNFLYLAMHALKDQEHAAQVDAELLGFGREIVIETGPANILGLEINEYAAELARVTVWIGDIQWSQRNGRPIARNPILRSLDGIVHRDALLNPDGSEAEWPTADVIVGNPPFLGDKKMRGELGVEYTARLRQLYSGNVPGGADLVCYWFYKARKQILAGQSQRAGLVSTNSIRGGANRAVLDAIVHDLTISNAWSDEGWINDGAAVRVSLVAFTVLDQNDQPWLNGQQVTRIGPDLTGASNGLSDGFDLTKAKQLPENQGVSFQGAVKVGDFDVPGEIARTWLTQPNPHGKPNSDVLRPLLNAKDLTTRERGVWIVDFFKRNEEDASMYEAPFEHVVVNVKPKRITNARANRAKYWWRHGETGDGLRKATAQLNRVIVTPRVSKYRFFVWRSALAYCDDATVTVARSDDTSFGILHSRFHELWSLRLCTFLGVGNDPRYTPSSTFETFPFPAGLSPTDTRGQPVAEGDLLLPSVAAAHLRAATRIAKAALQLNNLRENWLNPAEWVERIPEVVTGYPDRIVAKAEHAAELKKRTLTNLYNAAPSWLANAHRVLDEAVATAYGWEWPLSDDEILRRLFELNQQRSKVHF